MEDIKGVVLAGGLGKRLGPLTKITNKHLLPIYDRPMIYHPISRLAEAGIKDILIVTGGQHAGEFLRLLGNGHAFGLTHLNYTYQEGEGGIAEALGLAKHFAQGKRMVVILGDNIFEKSLKPYVDRFRGQKSGARVLLKKVSDPERFGVAAVKGKKIVSITEKPRKPVSDLAVTGVYMYDEKAFGIIRTLKPSRRGELEITDVNNAYLRRGALEFDVLSGWWTDSGTFDSLLHANVLTAKQHGRNRK
jgi:glucose-1-phosphate thymidylyltransferase